MADYYKSIYSGAQIDTSLGRIINGELDDAVEEANEAANRAESAADAIQSAIDNLPEGAVPVIDDLTTGGRTVALSAEQGKELKGDVDTAESLAANALDAVEDHVGRTDNPHEVTAPQIGAIPSAEKGAPNGVAALDGDGRLPAGNLLLSNDNLLDNAWFEVNQRGQTSYMTAGYTIDRFFITRNLTVTVNADSTITATGSGAGGGTLRQIIEANLTINHHTAAVDVASITGNATMVVQKNGGDYNTFIQKVVVSTGITSASGTPNASAQYGIILEVPNGVSITLKSAKLELGSVSTLHLDTPPSPAEQELNRQVCKRYYQRIPILYAYGHCASATLALVAVPVPVSMRITPSIIVENNGVLSFGATVMAPVGLSVAASNDNQVHIGVGGSGMTPIAPCVLHDAIIALSADL